MLILASTVFLWVWALVTLIPNPHKPNHDPWGSPVPAHKPVVD